MEKATGEVKIYYVNHRIKAICSKSVWAFGGDGWAYDIGFGGLIMY